MVKKVISTIRNNPYYLITLLFLITRIVTLIIVFAVAGKDYKHDMLQWDAIWYRNMVDQGYATSMPNLPSSAPQCAKGTDFCQNNTGFFPVFPMITKAVTMLGVDSWWAGFIVSNVLYLASLLLLYKLVLEVLKRKDIALLSVLVMLFYPASFVFGIYMTESTFIFFFLLAYYLAYKKKWLFAALAGAVLSATRNTGVLFIIPLLMIMYQNKVSKKTYFLSLLVPVGLGLFMLYLWQRVGDPLAFYNIQKYFRSYDKEISPFLGFFISLYSWANEANLFNHLYDLAYFILFIGLFLWNQKKKYVPLSMSIALLWIAIPMISGTTSSLPRFSAVYFPAFILIAQLIKDRKYIKYAYLVLSFLLMMAFNVLYLFGRNITS